MIKNLNEKSLIRISSLVLALNILLAGLPVQAKIKDPKDKIIVSLGDSYSAGEGIESYYGQGDRSGENENWLAHRSEKSWPGMLELPGLGKMADNPGNGYFTAVSGAKTDDILGRQGKDFQKMGSQTYQTLMNEFLVLSQADPLTIDPIYKHQRQGELSKLIYEGQEIISTSLSPQIDIFKKIDKENKNADYVTLTLGGNDAGFVDIMTEAVTKPYHIHPRFLEERLDQVRVDFFKQGGIEYRLYKAYRDIREAAGSQAHIIVAGYPQLLDPDGSFDKSFTIAYSEAVKINKTVREANKAIDALVQVCRKEGMRISFVSVDEGGMGFRGHGAYASFHPNEKGARAYAACAQARIDELELKGDKAYEDFDALAKKTKIDIKDFYLLAQDELGYKHDSGDKLIYKDFDNDGRDEAYVITSKDKEGKNDHSLYLINSDLEIFKLNGKGLPETIDAPLIDLVVEEAGDHLYLFYTLDYQALRSTTYILGVKDNRPYQPSISGQVGVFEQHGDGFSNYNT